MKPKLDEVDNVGHLTHPSDNGIIKDQIPADSIKASTNERIANVHAPHQSENCSKFVIISIGGH